MQPSSASPPSLPMNNFTPEPLTATPSRKDDARRGSHYAGEVRFTFSFGSVHVPRADIVCYLFLRKLIVFSFCVAS